MIFFSFAFCVLSCNPAYPEITLTSFANEEGSFKADGEITTRYAYWNWFEPAASAPENASDYYFIRTRLGLSLNLPQIKAYVQAQDVHMFGLPDDSIAPAPAGPLGCGAIYYLHRGDRQSHSTIIRQAYLDYTPNFVNGLSTRIGRFDYLDGLEVLYDNPKVNWLKKIRLSEKLIGPFGWSSFCRSFDGVQAVYDQDAFNINTTFTHPTQGGFENNANIPMNGINLATLTGTMKYGKWLANTEGRLFYIYYKDDRHVTSVVDNTGTSVLDKGDIEINTFGMHLLGTAKAGPGVFDWLIWAAFQTGDWGDLDHEAWAGDLEAGFQFTHIPWTPWIRAGYGIASGDPDASDGDHETFYQILPTARKYALFPFYNLMNNRDLFLQAILKPMEKLTIRADLHSLKLDEANDRWYMGAGPTQASGNIFGYIARPSFGDNDLATVCELMTMVNFSKYVSGTLYWGHAFGGDVIKNSYAGDNDGDYFLTEVNFKF